MNVQIAKIDVIAVMEDAIDALRDADCIIDGDNLSMARAAVAELIEAMRKISANGAHDYAEMSVSRLQHIARKALERIV